MKKGSRPAKNKTAAQRKAEDAFRRASVARGDAAPAVDGKLPPGATFEIEGRDEGGAPIIKRKRFSIG
jgi:hypothetical protein